MAVLLTIEGQYTTPSTVAGKLDIVDFDMEIPYPIFIEEDDHEGQNEAMFYLRNFFLNKIRKKKYKAKFKSLRTASITVVEEIDEEGIGELLKSGALVAIDPYALTGAEINKFKDPEIFWTLVLMDGDNTSKIAQSKSTWVGTDMNDKRTKLKAMLGIKEKVEEVFNHDSKKKSALFAAAGKSVTKNTERGNNPDTAKKQRPPRQPSVSVEVSD